MKVQQRDIVELNFELPDGRIKVHPALVVSNEAVLAAEDIFYAVMISSAPFNDEFSFELDDVMLTKPLRKKSFVKCQLLQAYAPNEVLSRISSVKASYFEQIRQRIFDTVF